MILFQHSDPSIFIQIHVDKCRKWYLCFVYKKSNEYHELETNSGSLEYSEREISEITDLLNSNKS